MGSNASTGLPPLEGDSRKSQTRSDDKENVADTFTGDSAAAMQQQRLQRQADAHGSIAVALVSEQDGTETEIPTDDDDEILIEAKQPNEPDDNDNDDNGNWTFGDAPGNADGDPVILPEADQVALVQNLIDSASTWWVTQTANPKLPPDCELPVNRQIAMLRALGGITQTELAEMATKLANNPAVKITQSDVSRAESDTPKTRVSPDTLALIRKALNMPN